MMNGVVIFWGILLVAVIVAMLLGGIGSKKYYLGKIVFKRSRSNSETGDSYYYFDVASNGKGYWNTYEIEVGAGAYNTYNAGDTIIIKL